MPDVEGLAGDRLKSLIERIETLQGEQKALGADVREVFNEAKSAGFCVKTMRKIIALRKLDDADRAEQEALIDLYARALGMQGDLFEERDAA